MSHEPDDEKTSTSTAFILWLSCLFGVCGVHRFYLGKPLSGLLYLLTFGLFGVGQVYDLFKMKEMVQAQNGERYQLVPAPSVRYLPPAPAPQDPTELMRKKLLATAMQHSGMISVSQGVMATGKSFSEVEAALDDMAVSGYVDIDNHPQTGAVVYTFGHLA